MIDKPSEEEFCKAVYNGLHHCGDDTDKSWVAKQLYAFLTPQSRRIVKRIFDEVTESAD